jgi:hypothetical protein
VNSDGKLDILVGDSVTLVEPAKGLTDEEFKAKSAEWQKELEAAMAEMNSASAEENLVSRFLGAIARGLAKANAASAEENGNDKAVANADDQAEESGEDTADDNADDQAEEDADDKADENGAKTAAEKRAEAQEKIQDLYSTRSSFVNEEMTGFVWLYLQK